jgi:hypothetical protein
MLQQHLQAVQQQQQLLQLHHAPLLRLPAAPMLLLLCLLQQLLPRHARVSVSCSHHPRGQPGLGWGPPLMLASWWAVALELCNPVHKP